MGENDSLESKVEEIFARAFEKGTDAPRSFANPAVLQAQIAQMLEPEFGEDSNEIAFHLSDWVGDAAFLTLLSMRPESLTDAEKKAGLRQFLIHAPNHLAAAAKLSGNAIQDIFNVNALDGIHQLD